VKQVPAFARPLLSVSRAARELEDADAGLRTPLALSRRVGVIAVEPGSGTSTVAAALGGLFAQRRRGAVLGVDAGGGGMRARLGLEPSSDDPDQAVRAGARTAAEARAGLSTTPAGLCVLDLTAPAEPWPAPVGRWPADVGPVARFYDLVLTDWGTRPWAADLTDAAALSHVVVLVARADRRAAMEAAASLLLLREPGTGPAAVLALVDAGRTSDRPAARLARQLQVPVLSVGYDAALRDLSSVRSRSLAASTRLSYIRLGRSVVEQAALSVNPRRYE
jgi:MinD-like ATPase involved in chromosome partitioning or flagellar assembly